jgi:hypothetical protein
LGSKTIGPLANAKYTTFFLGGKKILYIKCIDLTMEQEDYGYGKSVEEMQKEEEMLSTAFNNSYNYLTNKVTMDYVLHASESEFGFVLAHNTHVGPTKIELENMILHFIETEEYEKCAVLKGILNEEYPESINESLEEWL